ncbi:alpha/beta hydrolase [Sphaerisporangium sp. TRM90804]|uniref:alpha/beta hydrolase n=1 Tax=Sphaerisporangium sp. TRM90804 TaxID=3031113 RepID=UPI00244C6F75|nr:alpha/beta hydrolase [Sphaerisporangium sp. TRM90804]MDH2429497.1 alpha/beta hydrolase [Sphaerisporangium sp. TRM90804]
MQQEIDVDVTTSYPMSWQATALNALLRGTTKPMSALLLRHGVAVTLFARLVSMGERLPLPIPVPDAVSIVKEGSGACGAEWVRAGQDVDEGKVVLYFHGGGYFFCSPATHRPITWRLSAATRRPVLALDYRQGPTHPLAASLDDALEAYQGLLDQGYAASDIVLAGDSAGGHLTLATLLALRDRGLPQPAAAVCLSPWTDLSDTPRRANTWVDPMLSAGRVEWLARRWTAGLDCRDPLVSPVYGDYEGLPPLMIVTGSTEVLRDEGRRVALRAREAGVAVTYEEWPRMPHVFAMLADVVPEARLVFRHIQRFVDAVEEATTGTRPAAAPAPAASDAA